MPTVLERLHAAIDRHDFEAMLESFDPDYRSEQPPHPTGASAARSRCERTGRRC